MNKKMVDKYLPTAYEVLKSEGVVQNGTIKNSYRAHISTLGVMISMGSILSAVTLYCGNKDKSNGNKKETDSNVAASLERVKLARCIYKIITDQECQANVDLFNFVRTEIQNGREQKVKDMIINAAIALKLAINLYQLVQ